MDNYEQTMLWITVVQFIGFLLILLWGRDDKKRN